MNTPNAGMLTASSFTDVVGLSGDSRRVVAVKPVVPADFKSNFTVCSRALMLSATMTASPEGALRRNDSTFGSSGFNVT